MQNIHPPSQLPTSDTSASPLLLLRLPIERDTLLESPLLSPDLLDPLPVIPSLVPILLCALIPLRGETFVDVALDVVAIAQGFVKESASVTFVESGHDLFAVC